MNEVYRLRVRASMPETGGHACFCSQTGTISVSLRPSRPVNLNTFSYLVILPAEAENLFKDGSGPTEKKFVDAAAAAGTKDESVNEAHYAFRTQII